MTIEVKSGDNFFIYFYNIHTPFATPFRLTKCEFLSEQVPFGRFPCCSDLSEVEKEGLVSNIAARCSFQLDKHSRLYDIISIRRINV